MNPPKKKYLCGMKITLFLRPGKGRNSELPLYVRFRNGSTDIKQVTRLAVNPEYWDDKTHKLKTKMRLPDELRQTFNREQVALEEYISNSYYSCEDKDGIDASWLESVLATYYQAQAEEEQQADVDPAEDVAALFDDFVNSKERAESRRKQYMVIKRALLRYEMFKLKTTPGFRRFDVRKTDKRVLDDLTAFLRNEHLYYEQYPEIYEAIPDKKTPPHARGENTMSDLMKKIRAFYNWLELTGHIDRTPFKDYNMPKENYGTPVYLTKDEMQRIYHFDFKNDERAPQNKALARELEEQRDVFVFQCNIGCRVSDLLRLTRRDVVNGTIEYIPTKTIKENGRTVVVPLNETAKAILRKYSKLPDSRLLPFIPAQQYNERIREVLRIVGIDRMVTIIDPLTGKEDKKPICEVAASHMARRTFIGNLYKKVQDPNIVASLSGHVEGSRAFSRYREIDKEIKTNVVKLLDD